MPYDAVNTPRPVPPAPTFSQALLFWLKLGCISFGGPAGQIALMHRELVERRRWIGEGRFQHALNYCMLLPGPEAQQLATYLGWLLHGTAGGIAAGLLFVLPALVLILGLAAAYMAWQGTPWLAAALYGVKPVVVALIFQALWRLGRRVLHGPWPWFVAVAACGALLARLAFPWIVLFALAVGMVSMRIAPRAWQVAATATRPGTSAPAPAMVAVIDDAAPLPAHAGSTRGRLLRTAGVGLLLAAVPWMLLPAGLLPDIARFFTQAALVTFGGAYAVLPYVQQAAVDHHGWLSSVQMIDALALGESTPGPLIMIVSFVGFVAGWQHAALPDLLGSPLAAGLAAGLVATWYTFLPSFVFILAGAPLVEASRQLPRLSAPLAAVSAAVVGVIAVLAFGFVRLVCWPGGMPDIPAMVLALAAGGWLIGRHGSVLVALLAGVVASFGFRVLL